MRRYEVSRMLEPPFPPRINPATARVAVETAEWARAFGLVATQDESRRLQEADAGELAGRVCPDASFGQLRLLTDLFTWLFAFDDACDDDGLGDDPGRLAPVVARLLGILDLHGSSASTHLVAMASPSGAALHDLCRRVREQDRPVLLVRFVGQLRDYLLALLWEAANRQRRRIPGVAEYIQLRRHTGGVQPGFTLTDLAHLGPDRADRRADPALSGLDDLAADLVCWCNDVFSYQKERHLDQDGHNLVTAIARESGRDEQSALLAAAEWFNRGLTRYVRLEAEVLTSGDRSITRFVDVRRSWIRATWDWSSNAARYR